MKLHIGCGNDYKRGYINCDKSDKVMVDKVVDLEYPLPFKDNSFKEIIANHVLEHIYNFLPLMDEIYRICVNGAVIKIKCPFYAGWGQWNDPTHVRVITPHTFDYFRKGNYSHETGCDRNMFEVVKCRMNYAVGRSKALNIIMNPLINLWPDFYQRFFAWTFPAAEVEFELRVLK